MKSKRIRAIKKQPITVVVTDAVYKATKAHADKLGVTVPAYIRLLTIGHVCPEQLQKLMEPIAT